MKRNESFSARLSWRLLLFISIIFLVAIITVSWFSYRTMTAEATRSAEYLRDGAILEIEKTLDKVELSVKDVLWLVDENMDNKDYFYHITKQVVRSNPDVIGSAIAFIPSYYDGEYYFSPYSYKDEQSGEILSKQLGNVDYDYFCMDWFQIPQLKGEPAWSEPYYDEGGANRLMTTYSHPIKDSEGKVIAVMTADIALDWLDGIISEIKPYASSQVFLVSRCGSYINLGYGKHLQGETVFSVGGLYFQKDNPYFEMSKALVDGETGSRIYKNKGESSFAVFGPVSNGWKIAITCNLREVLKSTTKMQTRLFFIGIIGLILLFALCYLTIRKMTRPLVDFSESARSIAGGNFNTELPVIKENDEIGRLRDSFDNMQKSLTRYIDDLKQTTAANERFESELNIANHIQMAMLSHKFPDDGRFGIHAMVSPAREVGGDLYDFFIKDGHLLYFTVGDVSGKGIPASMFMAITKSAFRFIAGMGYKPHEIANKINNAICDGNETGMFVTMFVGCIDLDNGSFTYCNAGHNPIIVNGEYLKVLPNIAVGLFESFPYRLQQMQLEKGSTIVLYTDGVTEAEKEDKRQYGEALLLDTVHSHQDANPESLSKAIFDSVKEFAEGNEQNDDITIMTINLK